jgi:tetratricopeptide (TPR) repeat protein
MDALKKAEEEKKQAAKRLQEVEVDTRETTGEHNIPDEAQTAEGEGEIPELFTETVQFSLEPLSPTEKFDETKEAELVDNEVDSNIEREVPTVDASEAFSEDLTLESTVSEGLEVQVTFEETKKVIDLNDTTIIEGLSTENASAPFDDTFHGVIFEEEEQDPEAYKETLPGISADLLAKDLGGGEFQPTPVAAQTVFSAGRANKKQGSFKWGIFVVLALLATGSFAIFYYFTITPVSRSLPSPLIARGIESTTIAPPTVPRSPESKVITGTSSPVTEEPQAEIIGQTIEAQSISNETIANVEVTEQVDITDSITAEEPESDENKTDELVTIDEIENDTVVEEINEVLVVDEPVIEEISIERAPEPPPENIQVDASLIIISKSKTSEQENVMVNQAFKAYQDGHYDAARSIYEDVLKNDPDNRDAHLGLAAIAISNQDRKNAYFHYVHLLNLNPVDTLAMNALIGLSNSADPVKDESAIKLLMQREGNAPYLYFSLGNLYAKQKRWANAQQAFFDAYRLDTTNPDYVLNLAISLDHIGQYDTALDYYKTAIDLSQNSPTVFDPVSVNQRILVLSRLINSTP